MVKEKESLIEQEEKDRSSKIEVLSECDQEFDILGCARFLWVSIGDDEWSLLDDEKREIIMQPSKGGYVSTLYYPNGDSRKVVSSPLPLEYCSGVCEDFARRNLKIAFADLSSPWMQGIEPPTKGQIEYLQKQGCYQKGISKSQASLEIRKIISLKNKQRRLLTSESITNKQKYLLISQGIDPKNMNKFKAMMAISKIKQGDYVRK